MKRYLFVIGLLAGVAILMAQSSTTASWNGIEEVQTVSQCVLHGADSVWCVGTDGIRYSFQGAAFVNPIPPSSGGVTSVFGRTGAVTAQSGDYAYSQISGTPTIPKTATGTVTLPLQ